MITIRAKTAATTTILTILLNSLTFIYKFSHCYFHVQIMLLPEMIISKSINTIQ